MSKNSFEEWKKLASKISFPNKAFINGKYVDSISGKTFESINPATGEILTSVSECSEQDVDKAVNAARKSFEKGDWSTMPPAERKGILLKLADLIRANLNEFALLDSLDMGKLVNDAVTIDAPGSAMFFQWHAEAIDKMYDEIAPTGPGDLAMVARKPLGVIGAVVPWNFGLPILVGASIGWTLDYFFNTKPIFLILFLIIGFISGIYTSYKSSKKFAKN